MNSRTTLSAKGQVVIPKDVRDALGLHPGQTLDVVQCGDALMLRPVNGKGRASFDDITKRIRAKVKYAGPVVTIEDMNRTIADRWAKSGSEGDW
jgi:AbrB family looped-hinge helix DNA binding protein